MGLLTINCGMFVRYYGIKELSPRNSIISTKFSARAFASRKPMKKSRREGRPSKSFTLQTKETLPEDINGLADMHPSNDGNTNNGKSVDSTPPDIISIPSRSNVLQACTITSGLIAALGLIIRQESIRELKERETGQKQRKMGQSTNSTRPGPPHMDRPHGRVNLADSKHESHGRVPAESKLSPIQKRPILRAFRHSKAYKYTLEEESKGTHMEEGRNYSKEAD